MIRITIPGDPMANKRARLLSSPRTVITKSGKKGRRFAYDPQSDEKASIKALCRAEWNKQRGGVPHSQGVELELTFWLPIPKSATLAEKALMAWNITQHTGKPDDDNLQKTYQDCLTGIAYKDDCQVIVKKCRKLYSIRPRTEITIMAKKAIELPAKAQRILSLFDPKAVMQMGEQAAMLCDRSKAVMDGSEPFHEEVLLDIARIISLIADTHSKSLAKIAKECPAYYLEKI